MGVMTSYGDDEYRNIDSLSLKVALISILTSVYAVLYYLPVGFPLIGVEGARPISLAYFIVIVISILFPLEISVSSIALGGFIVSLIQLTPPFYILNFVPGAVMALATSIYFKRWFYPLPIYIPLIVIYAFYPGGGPIYTYPYHVIPHLIVLLLFTSLHIPHIYRFIGRYRDLVSSAFIGAFSGQAMGTLLFLALYYGFSFQSPEAITPIWVLTTYIYPIERIVLVVGSIIIYIGIRESIRRFLGESIRLPLNL